MPAEPQLGLLSPGYPPHGWPSVDTVTWGPVTWDPSPSQVPLSVWYGLWFSTAWTGNTSEMKAPRKVFLILGFHYHPRVSSPNSAVEGRWVFWWGWGPLPLWKGPLHAGDISLHAHTNVPALRLTQACQGTALGAPHNTGLVLCQPSPQFCPGHGVARDVWRVRDEGKQHHCAQGRLLWDETRQKTLLGCTYYAPCRKCMFSLQTQARGGLGQAAWQDLYGRCWLYYLQKLFFFFFFLERAALTYFHYFIK